MRMLLLLLLLPVSAISQDACAPFVARLHSQMELRDYASAFAGFEAAPADCAFTDRAYADVEQLLQIRLANAKPDEKALFIDALVAFYDKFDQVNPGNTKAHLVKKAKAYKRHADDSAKAWTFLDRAYSHDLANFTDAEALYDYFLGYHAQYSAGKVTLDDLLARYSDVVARLNAQMPKSDRKQSYRFAVKGIDALMDRELTCEKLLPVYRVQFNEKKDNPQWLASAAEILKRKKCADTLYGNIVERWHLKGKSAESALALAEIETRRGNLKIANELMAESASLEKDPVKKAESLYRIATRISTNDPAEANNRLAEALAADPKMGRALLLRATLYANSGCGTNDFERRAMNFLAIKTAMQAASVQPELKAAAEAEAARFRKNLPTTDQIRASKLSGKTLKLDCWVSEPVNIPRD